MAQCLGYKQDVRIVSKQCRTAFSSALNKAVSKRVIRLLLSRWYLTWPFVSSLISEVEKSIRNRRLFKRRQAMLVAVSGGLDSMVLLNVLQRLSAEMEWQLVVAHFNHRLRGQESNRDERFVKREAERLGLEFLAGQWREGKREEIRQHGLEMAARNARYQFLGETALRHKLSTIVLAHHADDQAELFFIRLLRGAGGEGLAGIKWSASQSPPYSLIRLIRPLLNQSKATLIEFAKQEGIQYREDSTNVQIDRLRNRIRHELLPLLREQFEPSVNKIVLRSMEILGAEAAYVEGVARKWLESKRRVSFARLHLAVQRQCLRLQLMTLGVGPDFELIERLRQNPGEPVSVNPTKVVARDEAGKVYVVPLRSVKFNPSERTQKLSGGKAGCDFEGLMLAWGVEAVRPASPRPIAKSGCEWFDADKVGAVIHLRHWQPGDRFQPIGLAQPVKLQDLFTNLKVPQEVRRERVVATTAEGRIFWVEGVRMAEQFKLDKGTVRRLKWQWYRS